MAKYANATHAKVELARENGRLLVEVEDDGIGGANPENGTGLRGLADRIAVLDGQLEIDSETEGDDGEGSDPMRVVVADDSVLLREGVVRL